MLHCVARGDDPSAVGRAFSGAAIELALASYPGFHVIAPPADASPYGVFAPEYVPQDTVDHVVVLADGERITIDAPATTAPLPPDVPGGTAPADRPAPADSTRRAPLGLVVGARSGDKGGSANLGVWARNDASWAWLEGTLTVDRLVELLPELAGLTVTRHEFANLRSLNFVVEGLLGQGVSSQHRFDPQAKALGEWLRSRVVDLPEELVP